MPRLPIGIVAMAVCTMAAAEPPALEPASGRTNFFAGREATLGTVVRGDAVAGRLAWSLAALGRTLASGTLDVRHEGGPATTAAAVATIPAVKEGVVVEAVFTAVLVDAAGTRLATHTMPVRIFPTEPFVDRSRWLESLALALVDPVGDTARALTEAGVPFTLVRTEAEIAAAAPRVLVVGEGASWLDRPDLPGLVTRCAARGMPVLCLAPREGTLPLSGAADPSVEAVATRLVFERAGGVTALDPRLDGGDWGPAGGGIVSRLTIVAEGDRAVVRIAAPADEPAGWPWLGIDYADPATPTSKSTLVICGYGVVAHWNDTPAARYLFAALLDQLAADRPGDRPDSLPTDALPEKLR
jgi:hypothetical protein